MSDERDYSNLPWGESLENKQVYIDCLIKYGILPKSTKYGDVTVETILLIISKVFGMQISIPKNGENNVKVKAYLIELKSTIKQVFDNLNANNNNKIYITPAAVTEDNDVAKCALLWNICKEAKPFHERIQKEKRLELERSQKEQKERLECERIEKELLQIEEKEKLEREIVQQETERLKTERLIKEQKQKQKSNLELTEERKKQADNKKKQLKLESKRKAKKRQKKVKETKGKQDNLKIEKVKTRNRNEVPQS